VKYTTVDEPMSYNKINKGTPKLTFKADITGLIIPKSVRFRIEFLPHTRGSAMVPPSSPLPAGNTTSITLVQEKGALSAFKAVYGRLRAEWRYVPLP